MEQGGWVALVGAGLSLALILLKNYFSDDAAKDKKEADFQTAERARLDKIDGAALLEREKLPAASAGMASGWDAADNDPGPPPEKKP